MDALSQMLDTDTISLLTFWGTLLLGVLLVTLVDRWFMRGW